eukprot:778188-Heterocapsa_arctica.AAC.1
MVAAFSCTCRLYSPECLTRGPTLQGCGAGNVRDLDSQECAPPSSGRVATSAGSGAISIARAASSLDIGG